MCDRGGKNGSGRAPSCRWWVLLADEKEAKKESCKSSCGEEADFVVWQRGIVVLRGLNCVVEP